LIKMIDKYDGRTYTQSLATQYVRRAKESLSVFNNSETKETLLMIADYTLSRKF
jgi:geranylgeranyl pyrophosphate synthase